MARPRHLVSRCKLSVEKELLWIIKLQVSGDLVILHERQGLLQSVPGILREMKYLV